MGEEIFKLFGTFAIKGIDEAKKGIDGISKKANDAASKFSGTFEKIGKVVTKVGKVAITGGAAIGTATAKFTKDAITAYADYEQLVGGVETLFKNSSSKVMEYANKAYKTAGLSANDYMEQATSFSASLLRGLNGDTEKAVEYANMAITDMADNANKMGTSIESIQNAYQRTSKR